MWKTISRTYSSDGGKIYLGIFTLFGTVLKASEQIGWVWLGAAAVIFFPAPVFYNLFKDRKEKISNIGVFGDQEFMIQFINGFFGANKITYDRSHKMSLIRRDFKVNGSDLHQIKIYKGKNIKDGVSFGIQIHTIGGACIDVSELGASSYEMEGGVRHKTNFKVIYDGERLKVIFLPFRSPKAKSDKFHIEFHEEHWYGAMRTNYDGFFFNEHNCFKKGVDEAEMNIEFLKGEVGVVQALIYNKSKKCLFIDRECSLERVASNHYLWRRSGFNEDEVYLVMYRYNR